MQKGFVVDHGASNRKLHSVWVEGNPKEYLFDGLETKNRLALNVRAFRCPDCNYLEFYTAEKAFI